MLSEASKAYVARTAIPLFLDEPWGTGLNVQAAWASSASRLETDLPTHGAENASGY